MVDSNQQEGFAQQLRMETAAVRLRHTKFGVRKSLNSSQREKAAESFGAKGEYLSAGKKLINTKDESYRAVTSIITRARLYWRNMTVPYPDAGIRLIRRDLVDEFDQQLTAMRGELQTAVEKLDEHYAELKDIAQERLGELFCASDYPASLAPEFSLAWEYPSVEPPDYLQELNPKLFEQEQERINQRFLEAVSLAEEAFTAELSKLVSHLLERLSGTTDDGKPKTFQKTAVANLEEFFQRFSSLNVGSNEELQQLVEQAEAAVAGVDVKDLRKDQSLRKHVAGKLQEVQGVLDTLIVEKPTRQIELDEE